MNLLIIAVLIAAAVVLCGYTTVRLPVRREEGKRHIACVGDSVTYGCTLLLFFLRRYPAVLRRSIGPGAQVAAFAVNCILRRPAASDAELNGRDAVCQRPAGLRY